jgi:superfamily II DNA or RNA helicase
MFDVILVDEAHHVSSFDGLYYYLFTSVLAPVRLGFTATVHKEGTEKSMVLEGLIGPVIGEVTMEEAIAKELIATPSVELISIPRNPNIYELRRYKEIYDAAIVNNRLRNKRITKYISEQKEQGKTALCYINLLEHIDKIKKELDPSIKFRVVEGNVKADVREEIKDLLNEKKIDLVIASMAWKEGINIPTVDKIINAGGGKAWISVLQTAGRGLRRAIGKEDVSIVDFIDCGRYISEHFAERMNIYAENGWL